jgi:hypothetical protein
VRSIIKSSQKVEARNNGCGQDWTIAEAAPASPLLWYLRRMVYFNFAACMT